MFFSFYCSSHKKNFKRNTKHTLINIQQIAIEMVDMASANTNGTTGNDSHKTVLVTGGCGYIGSHTIVVLLEHQYNVVVVDNLINSSSISLDRVAKICNLSEEERKERLIFHQVDLCDMTELQKIFQLYPNKFHSVIHFAGLKAVGESTRLPIRYYENNLIGTFNLIKCMEEFHCHSIVFSSSATGTWNSIGPFTDLCARSIHI